MIVLLALVFPIRIGAPWALFGAPAGVYFFYLGFRNLQRRRLILNTPASKVRSAAMGLVEVSGLALGPHTITAPVTGLPCYFYRTTAWQRKPSNRNNNWQKVADESLHIPFFLDDNTGTVLVDPQGAELDIHRDFHEEFNAPILSNRENLTAAVAGFLERHGVDPDTHVKVEEYCIKPKNALFILGTLATNPGLTVSAIPVRTDSVGLASSAARSGSHTLGLAAPYKPVAPATVPTDQKQGAQEVIRLQGDERPAGAAGMSQQEKIAAALTRAGITNPAAWAVAGLQPAGVTLSASSSGAAAAMAPSQEFDLNPKTVLMKGERQPAFFISWHARRDVVRSLGWKSVAMIWGGPVLSLLSAYVLLAYAR